ncbi:MAG: cytochrome c3 family protein [Desulfobulbaceae bacterium]|jgi:c(7)-type cytochrome triheme protein|nr:cytochrome c3 family protein [Desulfobulbaceae bacterium]
MKIINIISLAIVALLCAGVVLAAEEKQGAAQPYDENTYGPAAPIIWEKPVKAVVFSHKTHTMGAGLGCDSCHGGLFEQESGAAEKKPDFTMDKIYKGGYCGACHDGQTAFAAKTRCAACHIGARGLKRLRQAESDRTAPAASH